MTEKLIAAYKQVRVGDPLDHASLMGPLIDEHAVENMLRGLAENEVFDVAADQFDRVWARGPGSLTLISQ